MNKQQLQQEIAELQKQLEEKQKALSAMPDKWEPEGGEYYVSLDGSVCWSNTTNSSRIFGAEYKTREQAEKAAKAMRAHNRLLAYVAEFAPDYEFEAGGCNWFVEYNYDGGAFVVDYSYTFVVGAVYMPEHIAEGLADKLNSGEVEL